MLRFALIAALIALGIAAFALGFTHAAAVLRFLGREVTVPMWVYIIQWVCWLCAVWLPDLVEWMGRRRQ